jgi:hypothetical protein
MNIKHYLAAVLAGVFLVMSQQGLTATIGLDFAGGCPEAGTTTLCTDTGTNATADNVTAILGATATFIGELNVDGSGSGFTIDGIGSTSGTWSVNLPTAITHLAFKANGYFVLGQLTDVSGTWMMADPVTTWGSNVNSTCPASICGTDRLYVNSDFINSGGSVAELSNVRAFSVDDFVPPAAVPVPATVWLFGSGLLGLVGVARRRKSS